MIQHENTIKLHKLPHLEFLTRDCQEPRDVQGARGVRQLQTLQLVDKTPGGDAASSATGMSVREGVP